MVCTSPSFGDYQNLLSSFLTEQQASRRATAAATVATNVTTLGGWSFEEVQQGGFGRVFKVSVGTTTYAVKEVSNDLTDTIQRERRVFEMLQTHPHGHLVGLSAFGLLWDQRNTYFHMDFYHQDMFSFLKANTIDENVALDCTTQLSLAVSHLHHAKCAHNDIKPENIFVDKVHKDGTLHIKLGDYGLCASPGPDGLQNERGGSYNFIAPEKMIFDKYDGFQADIWSIGCVMCIFRDFTTFPYIPKRMKSQFERHLEDMRNLFADAQDPQLAIRHPTLFVSTPVTPAYAELLYSCLHFLPRMRPTAHELVGLCIEARLAARGVPELRSELPDRHTWRQAALPAQCASVANVPLLLQGR